MQPNCVLLKQKTVIIQSQKNQDYYMKIIYFQENMNVHEIVDIPFFILVLLLLIVL